MIEVRVHDEREEDAKALQRKNAARAFLFCLWSLGDEPLAEQLCRTKVAHDDLCGAPGRVHVARAQIIRALRRKRAEFAVPPDAQQISTRLERTLHGGVWHRPRGGASSAIIGAVAHQPTAFRDALILAVLFGFSTAETADALALPYPRALALISEGKLRLYLEFLRIQTGRGSIGVDTSPRASFESGVAETFLLTQRYIDAKAARPSSKPRSTSWFRTLKPWLPLCAATVWFAVPVFVAVVLAQCLLIRTFDGQPTLEATENRAAPAFGIQFVRVEDDSPI